jgi:hypothetical protein
MGTDQFCQLKHDTTAWPTVGPAMNSDASVTRVSALSSMVRYAACFARLAILAMVARLQPVAACIEL